MQVEVWQASQGGKDIIWGNINLSNIGNIIQRICNFWKTFRWLTPVCNSGEGWASQMMSLSADTTGCNEMISMYKIISMCDVVRVFIMFTMQNAVRWFVVNQNHLSQFRDMRLTSIGGGADEVPKTRTSRFGCYCCPMLILIYPKIPSLSLVYFENLFSCLLSIQEISKKLFSCLLFILKIAKSLLLPQVMLQIICKLMGTLPKPAKK